MELIHSIQSWFTEVAVNFGDGIKLLSPGGVAFAIFGARGVLSFKDVKDGPRWLTSLLPWLKSSFSMTDKGVAVVKWTILIFMSLLCGISLFSFGGGLLRDALILRRIPWFIEQINQIFAISIIILVYIPIHEYFRKTNKWIRFRNIAYFALVACDVMGLIEFAQGGQSKAFEVMQGQSGNYMFFIIFICGFLTQIGGGLCAIVFRKDFSKYLDNLMYYALAFFINTVFFILMLTGNSSASSLSAILLLSIIAGFFVDKGTREKMELYFSIIKARLSLTSEEIHFVCEHIKTIGMYKTTKCFSNKVKQIKPLYSSTRPYQGDSFLWKQGYLMAC